MELYSVNDMPPSSHDEREYKKFEFGDQGKRNSGQVQAYRLSDGALDSIRFNEADGRAGAFRYSIGRIRFLAMKSPFIQSYIRQIKNGVIGEFPIVPTYSSLGRDNVSRAEQSRRRSQRQMLQDGFAEWAEDCCVIEESDLMSLQHACVEALCTDGRVFVVVQHNAKFGKYPFRLLMLTKDMHRADISIPDENIINGVKYDELGRVESYVFQKFDTPEFLQLQLNTTGILQGFVHLKAYSGGGSLEGTCMVPAADVCDIKPSSVISRAYAYPTLLLSFFEVLHAISELDEGVLALIDSGTTKGGFLKVPSNAATAFPKGMPRPTTRDLPDKLTRGHNLIVLPMDTDFMPYSQGFPNADTKSARKEILRSMCAAAGIDYNTIASDAESVNFSSLRHMAIQSRETYRAMARLFILRFMKKVNRHFIHFSPEGQRLGQETKRRALMTDFEVRSFPAVDPRNDATASQMMAQMGAKSLQGLARDNGQDMYANLQERIDVADFLGIEGTKYEKCVAVRDLFLLANTTPVQQEGEVEEASQDELEEANPNDEAQPDGKSP